MARWSQTENVFGNIVIVAVILCLSPSGADSSCRMAYAVTSCYPDFQHLMERGVNLTSIFQFFNSERSMSSVCGRLNTVLDCIDSTMRGCAAETDPYDSVTVYWKRTSDGLKYVCQDRRRDFLDAQRCMASYDVVRDGRDCDRTSGYEWGSRTRRTCRDYEREVLCADEVILRHCGDRTARLMARVTRQFLKNTPETGQCFEPEYSASSKPASSVTILGVTVSFTVLSYSMLQ